MPNRATVRDGAIEVKRAHQAFLLSADEAKRINGEVVPLDTVAGMDKGVAMVLREPLGLVAAITPFNSPLNLVAHKVGPALAANNPVILKPSEHTPLTAMRMRELLIQAGLPENMLQIVNGDPVDIVSLICTNLMWPVILDDVVMSNPIVTDETFGPVAPFIRVKDFDEAIAVANDTPFGLRSGVFTQNIDKEMQAISRIRAGAVMINRAPGFRAEHLPFGGTKDSGLGREGINYAVDSMTQLKTVVL